MSNIKARQTNYCYLDNQIIKKTQILQHTKTIDWIKINIEDLANDKLSGHISYHINMVSTDYQLNSNYLLAPIIHALNQNTIKSSEDNITNKVKNKNYPHLDFGHGAIVHIVKKHIVNYNGLKDYKKFIKFPELLLIKEFSSNMKNKNAQDIIYRTLEDRYLYLKNLEETYKIEEQEFNIMELYIKKKLHKNYNIELANSKKY